MRYRKLDADGDYQMGHGGADYHVDTPDGLKALADTIKGIVARAQAQVEGEFAALRGGFDLPDTIEHVERFRQQLPTGLVKQ